MRVLRVVQLAANQNIRAKPTSRVISNPPPVTKSGWGLYTRGRGKKLPGVFLLQLSWVSSCEVHKTKRMTRVPIPTQLGCFKQAAGLFFCCSRKRASRSRSRESDCAARRPARCGRCELRCEVRCEVRCELRCRFRCQFRCELRAM